MTKNFYMEKIGKNARIASSDLSNLSIKKRNAVLKQFCKYLKIYSKLIIKENKKDVLKIIKVKNNMINRLELNKEKIIKIIKGIETIIKLKDPLNKTISSWKRPNGLIIKKVSIPIGIIGVIYESRPNVTSDVSALCF